jgi:hypothetical protein
VESAIAANNNQARALYLAIAFNHYRDTMHEPSVAMLNTAYTIVRKLGSEVEHAGKKERIGPTGLGKYQNKILSRIWRI